MLLTYNYEYNVLSLLVKSRSVSNNEVQKSAFPGSIKYMWYGIGTGTFSIK